ncbi:MAG: hypothetical protein H0T73_23795 [Ardenticatenales bacterium]|nr:hypothetical protein [Ardenticatenales bacterium]
MRVVSWNCRRASAQSSVWDHLLDLAPDLALLQEVSHIPQQVQQHYKIVQKFPTGKNGSPQRFMTTILVRGSVGNPIMLQGPAPWVDKEIENFAGNLVGVEVQPEHGPKLRVMNVYSPAWPVDKKQLADVDVSSVRLTQNRDVWVGDLLWAALSRIKPQPDECWIIGGDFNLCETFDSWRGGPRGNREYLDRLAALGLVDCLRYTKEALTPTFRTPKGTITAQLDYLFVTDILLTQLVRCDVGSHEDIFEQGLSDHLPLVADFALE